MLSATSAMGSSGSLPTWLGKARLALLCLVAFSASLPMAWVSLSKFILFIAGLWALLKRSQATKPDGPAVPARTASIVLAALVLFTISLAWTVAAFDIGLLALVKHAKLLEIILLLLLIRSRQEAQMGIMALLAGQAMVTLGSWLLVAGVKIPYLPPADAPGVVFSTYLDQGIMLAISASIAWHLRAMLKIPAWLVLLVAIAALADVMLVLRGRTGYVIAFVMVAMAVGWQIPKNLRLIAAAGIPMILALALFQSSNLIQDRVTSIVNEVKEYSKSPETVSSSGWRLNAWTRSVSAIAEQPLRGHGVGGWTATVKRLQGPNAVEVFGKGSASNPHQEYLLWGVELGVGGMLLLMVLLASLVRDFRQFPVPVHRAGLSVVVALAIACLFNSTIYDGLIGDYFCVLLGLLMALGQHQTHGAHDD